MKNFERCPHSTKARRTIKRDPNEDIYEWEERVRRNLPQGIIASYRVHRKTPQYSFQTHKVGWEVRFWINGPGWFRSTPNSEDGIHPKSFDQIEIDPIEVIAYE